MSAPGKVGFSKPVYTRPRSLVDVRSHFCPGCHHGTIHKIVAECIDRYGLREKTIGVACVTNTHRHCEEMLDEIVAYVREARLDADVVDVESDVIAMDDRE